MQAWIALTLVAVLIQSSRTVLQKNLVERLTVAGSTYARFIFGAPLAWLIVAGAMALTHVDLPHPSLKFAVYVIVGGTAQVFGNAAFVHLMRVSNFTVVATYGKTETVISALFSFLLLGDALSLAGLGGILITFLGVMVLSAGSGALTPRSFLAAMGSRAMLYGTGMGALYAVGSTSYRGAILSLGDADPTFAAIFTLACVTSVQALVMGTWLSVVQPAIFLQTLKAWRVAGWVGVTGVGASVAWYIAFSQQVTAYVLAVGQVELIVAFLWSHYHFQERARIGEIAGILVTVAGITLVVFAG